MTEQTRIGVLEALSLAAEAAIRAATELDEVMQRQKAERDAADRIKYADAFNKVFRAILGIEAGITPDQVEVGDDASYTAQWQTGGVVFGLDYDAARDTVRYSHQVLPGLALHIGVPSTELAEWDHGNYADVMWGKGCATTGAEIIARLNETRTKYADALARMEFIKANPPTKPTISTDRQVTAAIFEDIIKELNSGEVLCREHEYIVATAKFIMSGIDIPF